MHLRATVGSLALLGLLAATWIGATTGSVRAQDNAGAVHVVNHIDIVPTALGTALGILRQFAATSRKEPGCLQFDLLEQSDRGNHFALVEVWRDQKAFDTYSGADSTRQFRTQIQPLLGSPFDERLYHLVH